MSQPGAVRARPAQTQSGQPRGPGHRTGSCHIGFGLPGLRPGPTSNELRKLGVFVSPSGVRSIWLRHGLANFKNRLRALEASMAEQGCILTEAQVQALLKIQVQI